MTIRPIIFSAPMVRALLEGSKTQTRRLATSPLAKAQPDDLLWVREAWACHWATDDQAPRDIDPDLWSVRYLADGHISPAARDGSLSEADQCRKGRPSIFMPRWASRITLELHSVAFEHLRDIGDEDAYAEGVGEPSLRELYPLYAIISRRMQFCSLWESLHDKSGERWEDNPAVVALTFSAHLHNVDNLPAGVLR